MNIFTLCENEFKLANKDELSRVKSLSIGCFDSLHTGHFQLINSLCKDGALLVILHESPKICPNFLKEKISKKKVYFLNFSEIKELDAATFIGEIMKAFERIEFFVEGYDFAFAKGKSADINTLKRLSGLPCKVIGEVKINKKSVHTRLIKQLLIEGKIEEANEFLGRKYEIIARQIKGQGLGKKFFVPTINIDYGEFFLPKEGVYLTKIFMQNECFSAGVFIGKRSTDNKIAFEIHILDEFCESENYGEIRVQFVEFLRENRQFDDYASLEKQIKNDILRLKQRVKNER